MNVQTLDKFHKSRLGYLTFGLVELAVAYWIASVAVNSGNLWEWAITFILLFGFLQNFLRMLVVHKK